MLHFAKAENRGVKIKKKVRNQGSFKANNDDFFYLQENPDDASRIKIVFW